MFKASVEQSKITRAEGTFSLTAEDDGVGKVNVLAMGSYLPSEGVQGEGQIQVLTTSPSVSLAQTISSISPKVLQGRARSLTTRSAASQVKSR